MKGKLKRALSAALVITLLGSTLLTGCGGSPAAGNTSGDTPSLDTSAADSSDAAEVKTPADDGVYPTLTWYMPGDPTVITSEGYEAVSKVLNDYLEEKIGCHLELKIYAFSEYDQKCSTVISAGEHYDLMFTCDWINNFSTNAGSNAYLPLNDLLAANAPEAMADIPEYMWQATTINGNIYAMPALQVYAKNDGVFMRKDIAEEFGVKGSSYDNGVDKYTLEELGDIYAQIKVKYPDVIPDDCGGVFWTYLDEANDFNYLSGFDVPGVVRFTDEGTVINQFKSDEFMNYCKTVYDWVKRGYLQPDFASYVTQTDQLALDRMSPDHMTYRAGFTAPNVAAMAKTICGWEEEPVPIILSDKYAVTSGVTQSLTAIGINSDYPDLAVKLYNLAYSDEWFVNTMIYGIEDVNYTKNSDTEVTVNKESNYAAPLATFAIANQFITWVQQGASEPDQWEKAKAFCEDATPSELFGYIFDSSSVQNEVANCAAIYTEYRYPLLCGAVDPETTIPQMLDRMEKAGADKIIEEMQKQIDEFLGK